MTNDERIKLARVGVKCFNSFYYFFKMFWSEMSGDELVEAPHLKLICDTVQERAMRVIKGLPIMEVLMINVPPGSSKSTIITIAFPMWVWLHAPHLSTTNISYSATLSARHAAKARAITESEKWHYLFDDLFLAKHGKHFKITKQNQTEMTNNFKGDRFNTSVGGTITGMHADILIKDDMQNPQEANSDVIREGTNSWNDETLTSRHKRQTCYLDIVIAQRLHENDLCGHLLNKNIKIVQLCLPGEITANAVVIPESAKSIYTDGILDPVRKPKLVLDDMRANMGNAAYTTQVIQQPFNLEEQPIKPSMFNMVEDRDDLVFDLFIDGAYTEKTENDPTGILVTAFKDSNIFVKDCYNVYKTLPDLVKFVKELASNDTFDTINGRIFIEPKASGYSLAQYLKDETDFNVILIGQNRSKGESNIVQQGKTARHNLIQTKAESGRINLFRGKWNDDYITQLCGFPRAAHDEQVDNTGYAVYNYYLNESSFIKSYVLVALEKEILGGLTHRLTSKIEDKSIYSKIEENKKGNVLIYDMKDQLTLHRYLVSVSISNTDGLSCNIMVFDRVEGIIVCQVDLNDTSEREITKYTLGLSDYYNKAKIIFAVRRASTNTSTEETDISQFIIKAIRPLKLRTLYSRMRVNDIHKGKEKEYGFMVNQSTKREIYINIKEKIETRKMKELPKNVLTQLKTLVRTKENGLIDVQDGLGDNAVLNYAILVKISEEMKQKPSNKVSGRW